MSKTAQRGSSNPLPRGSGSQAGPSSANVAPGGAKADDKKDKAKKDKKTIEFQLPALSIVGKKKEINFELIRKKVMRRGNPEGEDKKQLAAIIKHLRESKTKIRVQEFVNLIAKFTSDNGEAMRKVMEEDLASFRKMVTKVYENMTQDVSDVLVNEQIQTANFYQERHDMFNSKMLWMISEIFQMIPEFDFEKYLKDKEEFLKYICPIPDLIQRDAEDVDLQKRQEAFHRLQWLKIEENRLAEENRRLEARLEELKNQHKRETTQSSMKTMIMEQKMHALEDEEEDKQEHLHELEGLLGKNIVRTEAYIRLEEDETIRLTKPRPREEAKKKSTRRKPGDSWSAATAAVIEEGAARNLVTVETALADEKKRMRHKERQSSEAGMMRSSEFETQSYAEVPSLRRMEEKTIQQTTTTIREKRPPRPGKGSKCSSGCGG